MADPVIEPENYNDAAAVNTARKADDYNAPASPESAEDYPDIVLILSESFYDFDLVTDLQADTDIMPVTKNLPNSVYGHTISPHVGGGTNSTEYEMLTSNSLILMPSITPFNWLNLYNANSVVSYLKGLGYSTMAAPTPPGWRWALTRPISRAILPRRRPTGTARTRPTRPPTATGKRCTRPCRRQSRGSASWSPSRATATTI